MSIGKVIKSSGGTEPPVEKPRPAAAQVRPSRPGVVNAEEFEARASAQQIIAEAQKRASAIAAEAEAEKARILEAAREQGRQEGLASVSEILAKAKLQRDALLMGAEAEILQLSLKVAEKIIGHDLERSPEVLTSICATAVEAARQAQQITIRVHPQKAQVLRANMARLMEQIGVSKAVSVKEDPEVVGGGCVLETPFGTYDAQLSTQFEMLKALLAQELSPKEPDASGH